MKTKNFLRFAIVALAILSTSISVSAQTKAERKALRNEVKALVKDGWKVNPGNLSLEEQMLQSRQILRNQDQWIVGEAKSIGSIYDAARSNALMQAKMNLAKSVEEVAGDEEIRIGNEQQGQTISVSASKHLEVARAKYAGSVNHPKMLMDCYRDLKNGNVEVNIRLAVPLNEAKASYVKLVKELEDFARK